ncbi:hypothetical protein Tco_0608071, partial [Tanacetum coccineum]
MDRIVVVQIVLWIVDSGCSKHITVDRSLLKNFIEKFMGTVRFGNDNFTVITGYGDYIQGNITICHVILQQSQAMVIINSTIGDDQIDSDIIFDSPNGNVNSGGIEKDTHVPDLCALEQLARNAYQEAEKQQIFAQKVQKQNTTFTSQLELYKERVRVLENINGDNNYLNEFLEADKRAKPFSQQAQYQFVRDRDIIRDLEKQRDKLDLDVKDYKR